VHLRYPLLCLVLLLTSGFDWPLSRARKREGLYPNLRALALIQPTTWEEEPESPALLDSKLFEQALTKLCSRAAPERVAEYAQWIEDNAGIYGEDPFLLGALIHRMSGCQASFDGKEGIGLAAIQPAMLKSNADGRILRYILPNDAGHLIRERTLRRPLSETALRDPQTNIEWAAALLAMWREQHEAVDRLFEQRTHRHYVSHFIWGDNIKSEREEDRVMTDRRRLLAYYGVARTESTRIFRDIPWGSPLEASPRVVSSEPGDPRPGRKHRGVDVEAVVGEPVLAMADGVVFFAGVDLPGQGARELDPANIKRVRRGRMGAGGRFICIDHAGAGPDEQYLRSCYMHLEDTHVQSGDVVKRGQSIGTVGTTGVKHSAPHLHLEIKSDKRLYDARAVVPGILIGDPPPPPKRKKKRVPRV
jgi:murein DD-endopeptidase MepM/ murein hydrolase activator NlpD